MLKLNFKKINVLRSLKPRIFLIVLIVGLIPCMMMRSAILQNYETRAVSVRISDVQAQLKIISEEVIRSLKGENVSQYDSTNGYIEMTIPIMDTLAPAGDDPVPESILAKGVMLISVSTDNISTTMGILSRQAIVIEVIVAIVVFIAAGFISYTLIRPFEKITDALSQVKEGYTNDPISVTDCLETEHIGDAFNKILSRMKVLNDSRQEFVSNVSHELKTPITSIKVLADSLRGQENVPIEVYQEFMEDIATEIDREDKIINDLLALIKMDRTSTDLNISQVDINMLVEFIMRRLRPIAIKRDIELVYESIRPVTAAVYEVKITLVITNLLENAIKYNKKHGWVKVTLDADYQLFTNVFTG